VVVEFIQPRNCPFLIDLQEPPRWEYKRSSLHFLPRQRVRLRKRLQTAITFPSWKDYCSAPAREQVAPETNMSEHRSYQSSDSANSFAYSAWLASGWESRARRLSRALGNLVGGERTHSGGIGIRSLRSSCFAERCTSHAQMCNAPVQRSKTCHRGRESSEIRQRQRCPVQPRDRPPPRM